MIFFMFNGSGNIEVIIIEVFKLNGPFDEEEFGSRLSLSRVRRLIADLYTGLSPPFASPLSAFNFPPNESPRQDCHRRNIPDGRQQQR